MPVQAAPNKCIIIGKIKSVRRETISPPKFSLELKVLEAQDIEGMPNFGKHRIGSTVRATTPEDASVLHIGATIRCTAKYIGDPFGGVFRLSDLSETS
jgi:hypothetical protein